MFPNSSSNSITATYCEFFKIFAIHIPPNGSSLILFKLQFKCHFLSLSSNVIFSKKLYITILKGSFPLPHHSTLFFHSTYSYMCPTN